MKKMKIKMNTRILIIFNDLCPKVEEFEFEVNISNSKNPNMIENRVNEGIEYL